MTDIDVEAVEEIDDEEGGGIEAPEYVLYGGKGGVGKTTMAAATALASAREGTPTLVVSNDPAHSLSDVLDREVPAEPASIHPENPLFGVEIDPDDAEDLMDGGNPFGGGSPLGGLGPFGGGMFGGGGMADGADGPIGAGAGGVGGAGGGKEPEGSGDKGEGSDDRDAPMPGADEAAALRLLLRYLDDERFERVVVDTAPTGHTLRLFGLPDRLDATLDRMESARERLEGMFSGFSDENDSPGFGGMSGASDLSDAFGGGGGVGGADGAGGAGEDGTTGGGSGGFGPNPFDAGGSGGLADLREFRDRLETLEATLSDPDRTDFRVVMVPERTSVVESRRLLDRLDAFGIHVGTIVLNRVMENVEAVLGTESGSTTGSDPAIDADGGDVGRGDAGDHGHEHGRGDGNDGGPSRDPNDGGDTDEGTFVAPRPGSCPFCRQRLRSQTDVLGDADDLFRGHTVKRVPLFAAEARGEDFLDVVAACLA
jgi:arsenite-transporting ATPase